MKLADPATPRRQRWALRARTLIRESWVTTVVAILVLVGGFFGIAIALGWSIVITWLTWFAQTFG